MILFYLKDFKNLKAFCESFELSISFVLSISLPILLIHTYILKDITKRSQVKKTALALLKIIQYSSKQNEN